MNKPLRRPLNVSIDAALTAEARSLNLNVSRACEAGLSAAVAQARRDLWIDQNKDAMESWNDWIDKHGLPLAEHRQF
jgi:antitoxin CcdA